MIAETKTPIRIYIDHWEDYESVGDQAMLLNALRRLGLYLGPCQFIGPLSPENNGKFHYPNLTTVVPPYFEIKAYAKRLKSIYSHSVSFFPSKFTPKIRSTVFLDLAISIFWFRLYLYSLGLHFIFSEPFREFLREIKKCDVFFTCGDCSLSDYWLDGVVLKSWLLELVRRYVSVSVLSSQGIGPLETPWARRRLVGALSTLDLLSFRDFSNSQALVESEGLAGVLSKIVMDEAFSLPVAPHCAIWKVLQGCGISESEPFIIVNFRNTDFTQNTNSLLDKTANLLDQMIAATHKKVVFLPMSSGSNYGCDYQTGIALKEAMKQGDRFYVLEPLSDVELVKGIIGAATYSIGISYHLHVFSLSQGHPTLILYTGDYYRTKSDGLISFYGFPNRSVDFAKTSTEEALKYILELETHYAEACAHVNEVNQGVLENNDWTIKMLRKILVERGTLQEGQAL